MCPEPAVEQSQLLCGKIPVFTSEEELDPKPLECRVETFLLMFSSVFVRDLHHSGREEFWSWTFCIWAFCIFIRHPVRKVLNGFNVLSRVVCPNKRLRDLRQKTKQKDLLIQKSAHFWFILWEKKKNKKHTQSKVWLCERVRSDVQSLFVLFFFAGAHFFFFFFVRIGRCVRRYIWFGNERGCGWTLDKQKVCGVFVLSLSIWANKWVWHIKHSILMKNA